MEPGIAYSVLTNGSERIEAVPRYAGMIRGGT